MRQWYKNLDWATLLIWIALCMCSLTAIYSSTQGEAQQFLLDKVQESFQRQLKWLGISTLGLVIALIIPVKFLLRYLIFLAYITTIGLLIAALLFGTEVKGARSWIHIGGIGFQSAELAKVGSLLMSAHVLANGVRNKNIWQAALITLGILGLPILLIILQNDLGTALVFVGLIPILWLCTGVRLRTVGLLIIPPIAGYLAVVNWKIALGFTVLVGVVAWYSTQNFKWLAAGILVGSMTIGIASFALDSVLQPHQVARIVSFTNPEADEYRYGVGFQVSQSKAAIASGGWVGKGFMEGSQTQGRYISEQSTDFVFSAIGEEWGFLGGILVLLLFLALLLRLITLSKRINHPLGSLIVVGTAGIFLIHVVINLGMVLGMLPVIGIPLPFLSYGGSTLLTNTTLLGLALAVYMKRGELPFHV